MRSFRFGLGPDKAQTYRTSCNRNGLFVHFGWPSDKDLVAGKPFRSRVPVWTTPADSNAGKLIAMTQSAERFENGPQPVGRDTRVVIGNDRIYIAEADSYEIKFLSLDGKPLPTIRKAVPQQRATKDDLAEDVNTTVAMLGERSRKAIEQKYAAIPLPRNVPPYRELLIDTEQNLWVQDYRRSGADDVLWTVFDTRGRRAAEVVLPYALEVYEIGRDYVLGRFIEADAGIPEVRMYRLNRK